MGICSAGANATAFIHPVPVNGPPTWSSRSTSGPSLGFTGAGGRIVGADVIADPDRIARLATPALTAAEEG